jgi:hypothetical protein
MCRLVPTTIPAPQTSSPKTEAVKLELAYEARALARQAQEGALGHAAVQACAARALLS